MEIPVGQMNLELTRAFRIARTIDEPLAETFVELGILDRIAAVENQEDEH